MSSISHGNFNGETREDQLRWLNRIFESRRRSTLSEESTTIINPAENQTLVVC